jgi:hypothetical protein
MDNQSITPGEGDNLTRWEVYQGLIKEEITLQETSKSS